MSDTERRRISRLVYLAVALLAVVNAGCLLVAAGAAAGGAAIGYVYFNGRLSQNYPTNLATALAASRAGLADLQLPIVAEGTGRGTAELTSRTPDNSKVRIYLEEIPSRLPVEAPTVRITVRVGLTGDRVVSEQILGQVGAHIPLPGAVGPPAAPPMTIPAPPPQPTAANGPPETKAPPLAGPGPIQQTSATGK
jgi:hypothetical protein